MTQPLKQRMAESAAVIRKQLGCESLPATLVVLGSGFKGFESELSEAKSVDLSAVVHCPVPKVEGHGATLVIGQLKSSVAVLTGRVHLYEGYDAGQVVYVLRVLATMGVQRVLLTNAAGSLDLNIKPGQVVVLSDHINCTGQNCLVGEARELGPIFIDMSSCYDKQWRRQIMATDILPLVEGVYAGVLGPNYETPSETKMLGALGAQVAGMSTVQ
jgi:purine-nucleoside phosphorylase